MAPVAAALTLVLAVPAVGQTNSEDQVARLLQQSRTALGGSALDGIHVLQLDAKISAGGLIGTGKQWLEIGGQRFAEKYSTPPLAGGDGYDGSDFWNTDGTGLVWVDGSPAGRAQEISQAFIADYALWGPNRGGAAVTWGGSKTADGRAYDVLEVTPPKSALPLELWFDRTTHLPERFVQSLGPQISTVTFSDYRAVRGAMIPYAIHTDDGQGNTTDNTVAQVTVNPADGDAQLAKPVSNVRDFSMAGGRSSTTVPIDLADNHVYLNVMLNGKGPYRFIFDSGAVNLVDPAVAKEVGALGHGSFQGGGVGSATESISFARVATLRIGDAVLKNQAFGVAPTRQGFGVALGQRVDGLIGFEVLARFVTTFDYANKRVVLRLPSSAQQAPRADVLPFVFAGKTPEFHCAIDGIPSRCDLDTGARDSITLFGPFMASNPQVVPQTLTDLGVNGFGFGGPALGKLGRLQSLTIGSFTLPNLIGDFTVQKQGAFAAPFTGANVGGGVWKRFALTLNYGNRTITLVPNATFARTDDYERAGLFLINQGGKYVVLDARPGTPAAQAGIVKGDTIDTIDGKAATAMSLQAVREMFFGPPGTVLDLGLSGKTGAHRTVALTLRDFI
jgi:hypothetical protein